MRQPTQEMIGPLCVEWVLILLQTVLINTPHLIRLAKFLYNYLSYISTQFDMPYFFLYRHNTDTLYNVDTFFPILHIYFYHPLGFLYQEADGFN